MLLGIVVLAAIAAALAAILLTRHHQRNASSTTVFVTTAGTPATAAANKPVSATQGKVKAKKLILPVPDLVGRPSKQATDGLRRAGFHVSFATVHSALPRGAVTAQDPKPGTKVAKGSDVRLNVSDGSRAKSTPAAQPQQTTPQQTTEAQQTTTAPTTTAQQQTTTQAQQQAQPTSAQVPSLSGDLRSVLQQLEQAGLLASIAYVPNTQPLGTVVAQSPSAGASVKTGSQVTVNVSSGPGGNPEETVADVVGQRIPQAVSTLNGVGLRLILLKMRVSDRSKAGVVVAQTPLPGKHAPKNAQVLVYMGAYQTP
jgi:beta-lactam-binding protein with PASTA domain